MNLMEAIELGAVMSAAGYGILRASRKHFDFVGICSIASAVAFGGGTLRDLFLNRHPMFWIENAHYPVIVFVLALLGAVIPRHIKHLEKWMTLPDALGLGLFSIVGAAYAMEAGTSLFLAAIFGVITGTFGGVVADVICNETPSIFSKSPLYATCSFCGAWAYLLLLPWEVLPDGGPEALAISLTFVLRLAAVRWKVHLPVARG